jgi:hypothetical protein
MRFTRRPGVERRRRRLLLLASLLTALAVVPAATADKPIREVHPVGDDPPPVTGQCGFPVLAHFEGNEINTTFTDKTGNPVKLLGVFPGNTLTLTNLDTDRSITLPATGSFQARIDADGSGAFMVTGHGPWFPNPVTGEPGIWYQSGQLAATVDSNGNVTSVTVSGTLVNLCGQLAS